MKRTALFSVLLLAACAASAQMVAPDHKRKPPEKPAPIVAPPRCSCWWQPVLTGIGVSALIGVPIYVSRKDDGRETRADVVPTNDGRGALLRIEVRQ
jgi:hypothetical protein